MTRVKSIDPMLTDEKLRRCAKAAHDAKIFMINSDTPDSVRWENTSPRNRYLYMKLARAVIDAMNEPEGP
jgi:hypothetical protein